MQAQNKCQLSLQGLFRDKFPPICLFISFCCFVSIYFSKCFLYAKILFARVNVMFELKDTFSTSSFFFLFSHCVTFCLFPVHWKFYKTSLRCNLYLLSNVSNSLFNPLNVHYLSIDTNCGK